MSMQSYLSAKEAAAELNISIATLYAYVSRGLIRSEATEGKSRARKYSATDIAELKNKQMYRKNPGQAAQKSLRLGMPVLDSTITFIDDGQLYYRGANAIELAMERNFEEVIAFLWNGEFSYSHLFVEADHSYFPNQPIENLSPLERFQAVLPLAAAEDLAGYDHSPAGLQRTGVRILHLLTRLITGNRPIESIAGALQQAWIPDNAEGKKAIEAALILCADHELNVSAFTARCIASAGSTLYQVIIGGLAALQGVRHGGHTLRVQAMLDEISGDVAPKLSQLIRRGEEVPGFWQPLYPNGDPRGMKLLELAEEYAVNQLSLREALQASAFVTQTLQRFPNLDYGLVTLARAMNLPAEAPIILFAIGRTSGWIAHALEQYAGGQLIRPRARYVGKMPEGVVENRG